MDVSWAFIFHTLGRSWSASLRQAFLTTSDYSGPTADVYTVLPDRCFVELQTSPADHVPAPGETQRVT